MGTILSLMPKKQGFLVLNDAMESTAIIEELRQCQEDSLEITGIVKQR